EALPDALAPGQRCTSTPWAVSDNPEEIAMANPDGAVLWPGGLLHGDSHLELGSLRPLTIRGDRRAPLGLSVTGGGVSGIEGGISAMIDVPSASTVREGVNGIIANAIGDALQVGAGAVSYLATESHSTEQTLVRLDLDARYLRSRMSSEFDRETAAEENRVVASFAQRLYTVAVDLPESPTDVFDPSVTAADLDALEVDEDNLPLLIDSVTYGRRLMVQITSTASTERLEAALDFSFNAVVGGIDGFSEVELQETLSSSRIEVFALGGSNAAVQGLIATASLASYFEEDLEFNQAEPISFTVRNLGDNVLATVGNTTEYTVTTCTPRDEGIFEFLDRQFHERRVPAGYETHVGDFDGDGIDDLLWSHRLGDVNEFYVGFGTETGLFDIGEAVRHPVADPLGSWGPYEVHIGNFDGDLDDADDVLFSYLGAENNVTYVARLTGSGWAFDDPLILGPDWRRYDTYVGKFGADRGDDIAWNTVTVENGSGPNGTRIAHAYSAPDTWRVTDYFEHPSGTGWVNYDTLIGDVDA
ncbi:MAG: thiol-activated cytolysin family protein, partial [Myxococcota bacterium]